MDQVTLSVWLITFNHECYIRECLEGVIAQKTTFRFEVIIGEDCSNDLTLDIIREFESKYPSLIKLIAQKENVGAFRNSYEFVMPNCRGKYVAWLEGDDYWTDEFKLQKQVDILESNPALSMCFHNVYLKKGEGTYIALYGNHNSFKPRTITRLSDLLIRNYAPTSSVCFRNPYYEKVPKWQIGLIYNDWPFLFDLAVNGDFYYIDEVMGVYRVHAQGAYSRLAFIRQEYGTLKIKKAFKARLVAIGRNDLLPVICRSIILTKYLYFTSKIREIFNKFRLRV